MDHASLDLPGISDTLLPDHEVESWITPAMAAEIAKVDHFRNSAEAHVDPIALITHYLNWYVEAVAQFGDIPATAEILDAGTGYGWLAIALAIRTRARITAIDPNERRLVAARQIAEIIGVADRIEFIHASVGSLPFAAQRFAVTFCIEVLEHIGAARMTAAHDLARVSSNLLLVTTPNWWFPIIAHDTRLPFCHMLPLPLRDYYANWFNRRKQQESNLFWSAHELHWCLGDFSRQSTFLQFRDYPAYRAATQNSPNPLGLSIGAHAKAIYYQLARLAAHHSDWFMPSLASTYRRIR